MGGGGGGGVVKGGLSKNLLTTSRLDGLDDFCRDLGAKRRGFGQVC